MTETGGSRHAPNPRSGDNMEILCACDQRYLPHTATMICSLLEHNEVLRIHLFCSSADSAELAELTSLVRRYGTEIVFYEILPADFDDLRVDKWASAAVYYRLLAARLLPMNVDKILYLDSDVIIRRPIDELWSTNIAEHALAAVSNYEDDARKALGLPAGVKYFNSGVLLINLRYWRQNNVPERAISFIRDNPERVQYWDQDALNATLMHQWVELLPFWNWQFSSRGSKPEPAIVHFITSDKPWHWSNDHPFKREYRKYRRKTPWRSYQEEGVPGLPKRISRSMRSFARTVLPESWRQWLRLRVSGSQAWN